MLIIEEFSGVEIPKTAGILCIDAKDPILVLLGVFYKYFSNIIMNVCFSVKIMKFSSTPSKKDPRGVKEPV